MKRQHPSVSAKATAEDSQQYSVLGIAFLVEETGCESRLVVRYPVSKPSVASFSAGDNVFYSLSPRVMAKIFRPKPALYNRPTTISVGETVFCCQTVPVAEDDEHNNHDKVSEKSEAYENDRGELQVFSVIVALKKIAIRENVHEEIQSKDSVTAKNLSYSSNPQSIFQNVHLTLQRICSAFEREEKRCGYLSIQVARLDRIIEENKSRTPMIHDPDIGKSDVDATAAGRHSAPRNIQKVNISLEEHEEILQTIWETQIANDQSYIGNLARELAECFHALSNYTRSSSMSSLPSNRISVANSGIVYVNGHIAVPIVSITTSSKFRSASLRPENTLLFTNSSSLEINFAIAPKPLQRVINCLSPTKSLEDVSNDLSLPVESVIELCLYFIECDSAIVVPKISHFSRYGCCSCAILKIKDLDLALPFSQQFGITIYVAISLVASGTPLGDIVSSLKTNKTLRDSLLSGSKLSRKGIPTDSFADSSDLLDIKKMVLRYVIWLRVHGVIIEIVEFVVASNICEDRDRIALDDMDTIRKPVNSQHDFFLSVRNLSSTTDHQSLFEELVKARFLSGQMSKSALGFKLGFEQKRLNAFIQWGVNNKKLVLVERIPNPDDVV